MVLVVRCLICRKELTYSQSNPSELVNHMKFEHPNRKKSKEELETKSLKLIEKSSQTDSNWISMMSSGTTRNNKQNSPRISNDSESFTSSHDEADHPRKIDRKSSEMKEEKATTSRTPEKCKKSNLKLQEVKDERQHLLKDKRRSKKFYKTSIERWRPVGEAKINCPRCQSFCRPTVRTQRQHVTSSAVVSSFLMTCWPVCFSPCYLPVPKFENLYCPVCNFHLGVFDHSKKIVVSNPNLVD